MNRPLQVLLIEDSADDAALVERELQRAGYTPVCHRVETPAALTVALDRQSWDLVLADYHLPGFDGLAALAIVKGKGLDLPFIIVSGYITEDTAVAAMKAGAHDYVAKGNLPRLVPVVERELREAQKQQEKASNEEARQAAAARTAAAARRDGHAAEVDRPADAPRRPGGAGARCRGRARLDRSCTARRRGGA